MNVYKIMYVSCQTMHIQLYVNYHAGGSSFWVRQNPECRKTKYLPALISRMRIFVESQLKNAEPSEKHNATIADSQKNLILP